MMCNTDTRTLTSRRQFAAIEAYTIDSVHGAVPILDQYDALTTRHAIDDDALSVVPQALAAYLACKQKQWG